eukprot:303078-Hanusia_phi.AAC.5
MEWSIRAIDMLFGMLILVGGTRTPSRTPSAGRLGMIRDCTLSDRRTWTHLSDPVDSADSVSTTGAGPSSV